MHSLSKSILAKSTKNLTKDSLSMLKKTKNVSNKLFEILKGGFISKSQTHYHKRKQNKRKSTRKQKRH